MTRKSPSQIGLLPTGGLSRWRCSATQACRLIGASAVMVAVLLLLPSPLYSGERGVRVSLAAPLGPALVQKRCHPLLGIAAQGVVGHHRRGALVGRRLVQGQAGVERFL